MKCRRGQTMARGVHLDHAEFRAGDVWNAMPDSRRVTSPAPCLPIRERPAAEPVRRHGGEHVLWGDTLDEPVNRLEIKRFVVDVHELDQRVPPRVVRRHGGPDLLPNRLRGREGMVAVAHRVDERWLAGPKCSESTGHPIDRPSVGHVPAAQSTAALHQLEIVRRFQVVLEQRLDDGSLGIVDEHHDVRRFQGRLPTHGDAGRQAVAVRPLRAANQFPCAWSVVECVEVQGDNQPSSRGRPTDRAFNEHESGRLRFEYTARQVLVHAAVDRRDHARAVIAPELRLGKNEMERRRSVADEPSGLKPIVRLGRVLVAGDHRPGLQGHIGPRQQQRRHMQADFRIQAFHGGRAKAKRVLYGKRSTGRMAPTAAPPQQEAPTAYA